MKNAVRARFVDWSDDFEGYVDWLYLDALGLVTTGMGNLVDPIGAALGLPFVHPDGTPATREQIATAWHAVKARQDLASHGGGAFKSLTSIRLTPAGVKQVIGQRLDLNDEILAERFPDFASWPADAQLFAHSMAWACGPHFRYPRMVALLRAGDFIGAIGECTIHPNIGTIVERNKANRILLSNASRIVADGLDRDRLWYPRDLRAEHEAAEKGEQVAKVEDPMWSIGFAIVHPDVPFEPLTYGDE